MPTLAVLFLTLLSCSGKSQDLAPRPFQAGERWCVLGDSITEGGGYHHYIELFYLTRFPTRTINVINCGIHGDTATGAYQRLIWDCFESKPTLVSVMLGMNDVGCSFYKYKDSQDFEKKCNERAETYDQAMRKLTGALVDSGAKVFLIKPSIFDDTADLPTPNLPGCGAALAGYGNRMQAIAEKFQVPTVDFNTPMASINAKQQKRDPHYTIVGPDRVHPKTPAHFVMAYEFLKAQKLLGVAARIVIDAAAGKAGPLENCEVTGLNAQPNSVSFTCFKGTLPFPVATAAQSALEVVPFTQELNQEILPVRGLLPGDYELKIDGQKVRIFSSKELHEGVNLAVESETPQIKQAKMVADTLNRKWAAAAKLRSIAYIEHNAWPDAKRPVDPTRISTELDEKLKMISGTNETWCVRLKKNYLACREIEGDLCWEMEAAVPAALQAAQPKPHRFEIKVVESPSPFQENAI
jgi:lysophospholipase L1-like esterase